MTRVKRHFRPKNCISAASTISLVVMLLLTSMKSFSQENITDDQGLKQGRWVRKDRKGQIEEIANFKNDTLHGEVISFVDGKVFRKESFAKGLLNGPYEYYDKNKVTRSFIYKNNVLESYKSFWKNGKERITAQFKNGLIDGELKAFYSNGMLNSLTLYRDGKILSAERIYDKKRRLLSMKYPLSSDRGIFVGVEYYDKKGKVKKSKSINERPFSYYLFGAQTHQSGPVETGTEKEANH